MFKHRRKKKKPIAFHFDVVCRFGFEYRITVIVRCKYSWEFKARKRAWKKAMDGAHKQGIRISSIELVRSDEL